MTTRDVESAAARLHVGVIAETFGNVVPEAMASTLAVVAFDDAAARAAIVSHVNGVTVATNDSAGSVAAAARIARNRAPPRA